MSDWKLTAKECLARLEELEEVRQNAQGLWYWCANGELVEGQGKPQWQPIDPNPEEGDSALVCAVGWRGPVIGYWSQGGWRHFTNAGRHPIWPTHQMPLPDPPKEEE